MRKEPHLKPVTKGSIGVLVAAALLCCAAPGTRSVPKKKVQPALELKISGTGFFRYGEALKFKAVVTNRSSAPVVLAPS